MFSGALLVGFVIVLAWYVEPLVFGVEFAGLLEDPTISVGMVCRLPGSTVDLAYFVQDFVEVGYLTPIVFGARIFLILPRAFESGVYCRALLLSSLFWHLLLLRRDFSFPSLTSDVLGSLVLHLASQLSSPAQKRVMRLVSAAIVLGLFWPRCLASHVSSRMLCSKAAKTSASGQSTIWFFLVRNLFQSFRADSPGC